MPHLGAAFHLELFVCFVALRPKSTAMVMAGRSVHLTTLFSWASLNKLMHIHSVAISEFPKWQTLFHLQNFKYILNLYDLKTRNANYLKF